MTQRSPGDASRFISAHMLWFNMAAGPTQSLTAKGLDRDRVAVEHHALIQACGLRFNMSGIRF